MDIFLCVIPEGRVAILLECLEENKLSEDSFVPRIHFNLTVCWTMFNLLWHVHDRILKGSSNPTVWEVRSHGLCILCFIAAQRNDLTLFGSEILKYFLKYLRNYINIVLNRKLFWSLSDILNDSAANFTLVFRRFVAFGL